MIDGERRYYGKYRGIVTDNNDPSKVGRLKARVPSELGKEELGWAMPCTPYAGNGVGFFAMPPVGASVWIEFENGDLEKPIWSGCFWSGKDKVPVAGYSPDVKVLKTRAGAITIDDAPSTARITIETTSGMKIEMTSSSLEITNGSSKIRLSGPTVSINDNALEVT